MRIKQILLWSTAELEAGKTYHTARMDAKVGDLVQGGYEVFDIISQDREEVVISTYGGRVRLGKVGYQLTEVE